MTALFDLDGVLLNSKPCMENSWKEVQAKHGLDIPFEAYFGLIGRPFKSILEELRVPHDFHAEVEATYFSKSKENAHLNELYPSVVSTLVRIHDMGHEIGIVTSKSEELTRHILDRFHLSAHVDFVSCPDSSSAVPLRGKPYPDHLWWSMIVLRGDVRTTVYVGDMQSDYEAANSAGVSYLHADWGYGDKPVGSIRYGVVKNVPDVVRFL